MVFLILKAEFKIACYIREVLRKLQQNFALEILTCTLKEASFAIYNSLRCNDVNSKNDAMSTRL